MSARNCRTTKTLNKIETKIFPARLMDVWGSNLVTFSSILRMRFWMPERILLVIVSGLALDSTSGKPAWRKALATSLSIAAPGPGAWPAASLPKAFPGQAMWQEWVVLVVIKWFQDFAGCWYF